MYQQIGHIIVMLVLLVCSAFFSGSETAFFNLSRKQIQQIKDSKHRFGKILSALFARPGRLLNALLFGNMMVNVLFFATASVLSADVGAHSGWAPAIAIAVLDFGLLVLCGEIVPKSLAFANSRSVALVAAAPAYVWLRIYGPLDVVFRYLILEPFLRLLLGPARGPKDLTVEEFRSLIELSRKQELISDDETRLLDEVIELGMLRVRHVMRPRVDMVGCEISQSPAKALEIMRQNGLTKLPVYVGAMDQLTGMVHARNLLLEPELTLDKQVQPAIFVPEQGAVESVLEYFRRRQTDMAIVVDEYGGIAGSVSLEDIAEELFGEMQPVGSREPVEQIGPFQYRLAGDVPIHDWTEVLGVNIEKTRLTTVGGLVASLMERIPKIGDVVHLGNLKFTVEKMDRHRVHAVILSFESLPTNGN